MSLVVKKIIRRGNEYLFPGGGAGSEAIVGRHLAEPFFHPDPDPPVGSIRGGGELFDRTLYAALWAEVQRLNQKYIARGLAPLIAESDSSWLAEANSQDGYCAKYSPGDGATTFRVPFYGRVFASATMDAEIGRWVNDAIVNIVGDASTYGKSAGGSPTGAFSILGTRGNRQPGAVSSIDFGYDGWHFDASSSPGVRTGPEVTMKAVYLPIYIHAHHSITPAADLDMQGWLNALNGKLDKTDYSGFPGDTYIDLPWGASGMTWTAPSDGKLFAWRSATGGSQYIQIAVFPVGTTSFPAGQIDILNACLFAVFGDSSSAGGHYFAEADIAKNQIALLTWTLPTAQRLVFIPARAAA